MPQTGKTTGSEILSSLLEVSATNFASLRADAKVREGFGALQSARVEAVRDMIDRVMGVAQLCTAAESYFARRVATEEGFERFIGSRVVVRSIPTEEGQTISMQKEGIIHGTSGFGSLYLKTEEGVEEVRVAEHHPDEGLDIFVPTAQIDVQEGR